MDLNFEWLDKRESVEGLILLGLEDEDKLPRLVRIELMSSKYQATQKKEKESKTGKSPFRSGKENYCH